MNTVELFTNVLIGSPDMVGGRGGGGGGFEGEAYPHLNNKHTIRQNFREMSYGNHMSRCTYVLLS